MRRNGIGEANVTRVTDDCQPATSRPREWFRQSTEPGRERCGETPFLAFGMPGGDRWWVSRRVVVKIGSKKFTKTLTKGKVKVRGPRLKKRGTVKVSVTYRPAAKTYTKPAKVKAKIQVR